MAKSRFQKIKLINDREYFLFNARFPVLPIGSLNIAIEDVLFEYRHIYIEEFGTQYLLYYSEKLTPAEIRKNQKRDENR